MKKITILSCLLFIFSILIHAQPRLENVKIIITPDHPDWIYDVGEQVSFEVSILQYSVPVKDAEISYEIMPEKMEAPEKKALVLKEGRTSIKGGTMNEPGLLRCRVSTEVNGYTYTDFTTVAFEPLKIKPTTELPDDFTEFWDKAKADLAKVPVKPLVTLLPERCTPEVNVYHVRLNNLGGHIYGILAMPKEKGSYAAILGVPGAGIRPYYGDISRAEKGFITFQIGIHGVPVTMDQSVYSDLMSGALNSYWTTNLDDMNKYYYKRVYLGCVRAVDFIYSLPEFNGEDLAVTGGSQGGALSIITAGLDERIDYVGSFYPALSDLTGYLNGRAGGWPHMFRDGFTNKPEKVETSKYYDVVNFARFVKAEGMYSWGFNDNVCPPTSMYSAYNVIEAPKQLKLYLDTRHWTYPEQRDMMNEWLFDKLLTGD